MDARGVSLRTTLVFLSIFVSFSFQSAWATNDEKKPALDPHCVSKMNEAAALIRHGLAQGQAQRTDAGHQILATVLSRLPEIQTEEGRKEFLSALTSSLELNASVTGELLNNTLGTVASQGTASKELVDKIISVQQELGVLRNPGANELWIVAKIRQLPFFGQFISKRVNLTEDGKSSIDRLEGAVEDNIKTGTTRRDQFRREINAWLEVAGAWEQKANLISEAHAYFEKVKGTLADQPQLAHFMDTILETLEENEYVYRGSINVLTRAIEKSQLTIRGITSILKVLRTQTKVDIMNIRINYATVQITQTFRDLTEVADTINSSAVELEALVNKEIADSVELLIQLENGGTEKTKALQAASVQQLGKAKALLASSDSERAATRHRLIEQYRAENARNLAKLRQKKDTELLQESLSGSPKKGP